MGRESHSVSRTCFIVAPPKAATALLEHALEQRDIRWVAIETMGGVGGSLITSLLHMMKESDFVCAVLAAGEPGPNVMFELGLALGLGKSMFVIGTGDHPLPFGLNSQSVVRFVGSSPSALEGHLDAFLRTLPVKRPSSKGRRQRQGEPVDTRWAYARLRSLQESSGARELEFENLIAEVFERWGYSVTRAPGRDYGADLAVWSPDLKRRLGNPILVELKARRLNEADSKRTISRLAEMIRDGQGSMALLVSSERAATQRESLGGESPVVCLSAEELIQHLSVGGFTDILLSSREDFLRRKS